jgi:hypothetical protein
MKFRNGFVSNSSSSSYIVTNKTNEKLTWKQFTHELLPILKSYIKEYKYCPDDQSLNDFTKDIINKAINKIMLKNNDKDKFEFGDSHGIMGLLGAAIDNKISCFGITKIFETEKVKVEFLESHH